MTEKKSAVGEILGIFLVLGVFALLFGPFVLFEMNAHSGVKTEYAMTKVGWLMHPVTAGENRLVRIRDRATAKVVGSARGLGYSARTEEFLLTSVPADLKQDFRYEFHLKCTKIGTLPNPITYDRCDVISIRERGGARIVQVDDPMLRRR